MTAWGVSHHWTCPHTNRTPEDEAPERYVICCDCGAVLHTRWTGKVIEQIMERVRGERPAGTD